MGFPKNVKVKAVILPKKLTSNICNFDINISKLKYWKEFNPIILLTIHKILEIVFFSTVIRLGSFIGLRIKAN